LSMVLCSTTVGKLVTEAHNQPTLPLPQQTPHHFQQPLPPILSSQIQLFSPLTPQLPIH
jgi:hypothetical protein